MSGSEIARFAVPAPAPGEWSLRVWLRDAAGNQAEANASVPVTLRYDPEAAPARLRAAAGGGSDARFGARSTDNVSGIAGGANRDQPRGRGTWQTLADPA